MRLNNVKKTSLMAIMLAAVISLSGVVMPMKVAAEEKIIEVAVVGDSISEFNGDSCGVPMAIHNGTLWMGTSNYNSTNSTKTGVKNNGQMWYSQMQNALNESGKKFRISRVDAIGGSMVYDTGDTIGTWKSYAEHKGGAYCIGSDKPFSTYTGFDGNYGTKSRLESLGNPNIIVIEAGTNDVLNNVDQSSFTTAYANMIGRYHSMYPNAKIYVVLPSTNLGGISGNGIMYRGVINWLYQNGWPISGVIDPAVIEQYRYDGIHYTEIGQFYLGYLAADKILEK